MAKVSKKKKRVDAEGIAFIKASFNNTIITLCDKFGNAITWASAGELEGRASVLQGYNVPSSPGQHLLR